MDPNFKSYFPPFICIYPVKIYFCPGGNNNYLPNNVEEIHYMYLNETVGFSGPGLSNAKWYQRAADGTETWNADLVFKSTEANGLIVGELELCFSSKLNQVTTFNLKSIKGFC